MNPVHVYLNKQQEPYRPILLHLQAVVQQTIPDGNFGGEMISTTISLPLKMLWSTSTIWRIVIWISSCIRIGQIIRNCSLREISTRIYTRPLRLYTATKNSIFLKYCMEHTKQELDVVVVNVGHCLVLKVFKSHTRHHCQKCPPSRISFSK